MLAGEGVPGKPSCPKSQATIPQSSPDLIESTLAFQVRVSTTVEGFGRVGCYIAPARSGGALKRGLAFKALG